MVEYIYIGKNPKNAIELIKKFIADPDSNSGIVTVPKVIGAGESVTIPAGRIAVLPNVQVDGTLNVLGEVFIPAGSTVDMGNGLAINGEKVVMSVPASYHLLQGNLAVDNTVITQGFNTTLYTGNGTTQSINTGIDMDTQWGDTAEEKFGGLVWLKGRSAATSHLLVDTVRGSIKEIFTESTSAEMSQPTGVTSFNLDGFSLGSMLQANGNAATYASWNFQTTHRITGTTNHGKPYTCHYNPFTGFTIVKYEGSGLVGHEIPHHLGRKLEFGTFKNLNQTLNWNTATSVTGPNKYLILNGVDAIASTTNLFSDDGIYEDHISLGTGAGVNGSGNSIIFYGWANSYYDENKLIGNYEIGVYQGTGVAGNKVTTRGKPAWLMFKRLDATGYWHIVDNKRNISNPINSQLYPNMSNAEYSGTAYNMDFNLDSFVLNGTDVDMNASGGQYLYIVAYDTNSNGGGSYYPKATDNAQVQINNALIPIAKGSDINGLKNVMLSKNESITGLTYTAGKNYIYYDGNGNKGVKAIAPNYGTTNPSNGGDFYNILKNKWYTSSGVEIPEGRNYLNHIVHADNDGGVLYVEELPKIEYKDVIKANEYQGKNACTAWVNFDGTTTPPTIRDSYNVSKVVRVATGIFDVYFENEMDNIGYSFTGDAGLVGVDAVYQLYRVCSEHKGIGYRTITKVRANTGYVYSGGQSLENQDFIDIQIFGGKN